MAMIKMHRNCTIVWIAALLFAIILPSFGQIQPISTDRPDQSTTPVLVPQGALQIESGYSWAKQTTNDIDKIATTFNNTLIKYGLTKKVELILNASFVCISIRREADMSMAFTPVSLGTKVRIADERRVRPEISVVATLAMQDVLRGYCYNSVYAEMIVACSNTLTNKSSLTYNAIFREYGSEQFEAGYTIAYGYNIGRELGLFLESYGNIPAMSKAAHYVNGGVTFKLTPIFQIDASGGCGLNEKYIFFGIGLSVRCFQ